MSRAGFVCLEACAQRESQDLCIYVGRMEWEQMGILIIHIKASALPDLQLVEPPPSLLVHLLYSTHNAQTSRIYLMLRGKSAGINMCL